MPLIACRECKQQVSSEASKCPKCGIQYPCPLKHKEHGKNESHGCIIVMVCILLVIFFSFASELNWFGLGE